MKQVNDLHVLGDQVLNILASLTEFSYRDKLEFKEFLEHLLFTEELTPAHDAVIRSLLELIDGENGLG